MHVSGSILIAIGTGVLIGVAAGMSIYAWLEKADAVPVSDLSTPSSVTMFDTTSSSPADVAEVRADELDSHLRVQSVLESIKLKSNFNQSVSLYLLLARANKGNLDRYISESVSISSRNQRIAVLPIVFERYAALDPHQALERALALDQLTARERTIVVRSLFREWADHDLESAIAAIDNLPDAYKFTAATAVMSRNDHLSKDQQIQLAQEIGLSEQWINNMLISIRREAAKVDPRSAFYELIRDPTNPRYAHMELITIVKHWIELEGAEVLSEIDDSITDTNLKSFLYRTMFLGGFGSGNVSPIEMIRVVSEFPNRQDAKASMEQLLRSWSRSAPKQSFEYSFEFGDQFINREFRKTLLQSWAASDAEGLLSEADSLPREYHDVAVVTALGRMSRASPKEAIQIARSLGRPELQRQARDEIVKQWSFVSANDAFEWLVNDGFNIDDQNDTKIFSEALSSYLRQDLDAAQNFVSDYQGALKNQFVETVARHLVNVDVERAIDYLPNVSKEHRTALQLDIGRQLVDGEALKALSFGKTVDESRRDQYYDTVLDAWAQNNFFALHENIQRVPADYRRYAAEAVLTANANERALSDREIQNLESMVPKRQLPSGSFSGTIQIDSDNNASVQIHRR